METLKHSKGGEIEREKKRKKEKERGKIVY